MRKSLFPWAVFILATALNLRLFLSRWAELPLTEIPNLLSAHTTSSLFLGVGVGVVLLGLLGQLAQKRLLWSCILFALGAGFLWCAHKVPVFRAVLAPDRALAIIGSLLAILCLRTGEYSSPAIPRIKWGSFALYALASFNVFLIVAPFTTFPPGYVQDSTSPGPSSAFFYYGSVHSDISMVSVFLRKIINSFFDHPSINATIVSSMILVAIGLACAALAFEMLFGTAWGWLLLFASWTDRYLLAAAIASSVVSMPILSVGSVFLICVWSLIRQPRMLTWKETWFLAAFNAVSLLYSLYSYSAARIPWLIGSIVAAIILLVRGAIPFNASGIRRAIASCIPSLLLLTSILVFIFNSDLDRFKAQILISPKKEQIIKNVNDYPVKVTPIHDVDGPIWWGTGRPEGINLTVYWRRTPQEIYEKATWFIKQFTDSTPVAPYALLVAALSLITLGCSPFTLWRALAIVSFMILVGAFAPFILAQDASAYRRALGTDLMILIAIVSMFATRRRHGMGSLLSAGLFAGLCLIKAPLELSPLFSRLLHGPLCIACHEHFDVRYLVNDPVYQAVKDRALIFAVGGKDDAELYHKCAVSALDSYEMRSLSPNVRYITLGSHSLEETFNSFKAGEILVATCPTVYAPEEDKKALCAGSPPFGRFLGLIKDPNHNPYDPAGPRTKWVFIEKTG